MSRDVLAPTEALQLALAALNRAPRFKVPARDTDSYSIALEIERTIARENNRTLAVSAPHLRSELEVVFDLTANLYQGFGDGSVTYEEFPDSRSRLDTVLGWAAKFQDIHSATNWDEVDYIETIDDFFTTTLAAHRECPTYFRAEKVNRKD